MSTLPDENWLFRKVYDFSQSYWNSGSRSRSRASEVLCLATGDLLRGHPVTQCERLQDRRSIDHTWIRNCG